MTTTAHTLELVVYNDAIRKSSADLAAELRLTLGAKLTAYIGSVQETRAVREWADGTRQPSAAVTARLRLAHHAAKLIEQRESRDVAIAWFSGINPQLGDRGPATVIREGNPDEVGRDILAAARSFVGTA